MGRAKQAELRKLRARARRQDVAGLAEAERCGLTYLQRMRPKPVTRRSYDVIVQRLLRWAGLPTLSKLSIDELDQLLARHLDFLYLEGELGESGSRLLAAVHHCRPDVPRAKFGSLPRARAALAGFRRRDTSSSMDPLPKPVVFAMAGLAILQGDVEFAASIALAWDAMLRLPSDLLAMSPESLVGPGRANKPQWALLLYPQALGLLSKTRGTDEGVVLRGGL